MTTVASDARPPRVAACLVDVCALPDEAEALLGDLREEFGERADRNGAAEARRWYRREAVRTSLHLAFGPFRQRPWSMAATGALGMAMMWPAAWLVKQAATRIVLDFPVYYYVSATLYWQVAGEVPLFLIGLGIARFGRVRPVAAVLAIVAAMALMVCLVDPVLVSILDPRATRTLGFYAWRATAGLAMWASDLMLGAVLGRVLFGQAPARRTPNAA